MNRPDQGFDCTLSLALDLSTFLKEPPIGFDELTVVTKLLPIVEAIFQGGQDDMHHRQVALALAEHDGLEESEETVHDGFSRDVARFL